MDLFFFEKVFIGLVMFVYGGYWYKFDKFFWLDWVVGVFVYGWVVCLLSYDLCLNVCIL